MQCSLGNAVLPEVPRTPSTNEVKEAVPWWKRPAYMWQLQVEVRVALDCRHHVCHNFATCKCCVVDSCMGAAPFQLGNRTCRPHWETMCRHLVCAGRCPGSGQQDGSFGCCAKQKKALMVHSWAWQLRTCTMAGPGADGRMPRCRDQHLHRQCIHAV